MVLETAILAAGCFWGVETLFKKLPGVEQTTVGYTGGSTPNPTYEAVSTGMTGHAEAIQIKFNPKKISYKDLLIYFFKLHDPTTLNRQMNDRGTQYRSAIFYTTQEQKKIAQALKDELDKRKVYTGKIVTEITKAGKFYSAEQYHQDYHDKNPNGYHCHFLRNWNY
jgi:methionine-S-sulfoxide reductase